MHVCVKKDEILSQELSPANAWAKLYLLLFTCAHTPSPGAKDVSSQHAHCIWQREMVHTKPTSQKLKTGISHKIIEEL